MNEPTPEVFMVFSWAKMTLLCLMNVLDRPCPSQRGRGGAGQPLTGCDNPDCGWDGGRSDSHHCPKRGPCQCHRSTQWRSKLVFESLMLKCLKIHYYNISYVSQYIQTYIWRTNLSWSLIHKMFDLRTKQMHGYDLTQMCWGLAEHVTIRVCVSVAQLCQG